MGASSELKALRNVSQDIVAILSSDSGTVEWLRMGMVNKGLLTEEQCQHAVSSEVSVQENVRSLVKRIEEQVEGDPTKFQVFIELLRENKLFRTLVAKLLNSLGEHVLTSHRPYIVNHLIK